MHLVLRTDDLPDPPVCVYESLVFDDDVECAFRRVLPLNDSMGWIEADDLSFGVLTEAGDEDVETAVELLQLVDAEERVW